MNRSRREGRSALREVNSDTAAIERGVCAGWCELLSRGPAASISRNSLRTKGAVSWLFRAPRSHCTGHVLCGGGCDRYRRQAR